MKKYLAIFAVLFTVILSSCSNDDIPVNRSSPHYDENQFTLYTKGQLVFLLYN